MRGWRPARWSTAVLVGLSSGVVTWVGLDWWQRGGHTLPPLPWTAVVVTALLAVVVLFAGLPVRRWMRGDRSWMLDPLVAARTVVLAKAAVLVGAACTGWYGAQALTVVPDLVGSRVEHLLLALAGTVSAVALMVAGFLVQNWCRIPPPDEDAEREGSDPSVDPGH